MFPPGPFYSTDILYQAEFASTVKLFVRRRCSKELIINREPSPGRITMVLVKANLGF